MSARPDARSLFAAARADGPDDAARADMFSRVAMVTGAAGATATVVAATATSTAPAAGAGAVKAASSAIGMKLLAIGGLIGAAGTALGVLVTLAFVEPVAKSPNAHDRPVFTAQNGSSSAVGAARSRAPTIGAKRADDSPRVRDPEQLDDSRTTPATTPTKTDAPATDPRATSGIPNAAIASARLADSDLTEEARLVTEARRALVGGDPARALAMVQATRKLGSRSMEPEELGLEARALRALGRADDAAATELVLRRRFPDHALAR